MNLDDQICYCYHVSLRKLVNFARRERPPRASCMSNCLGAGTGCGWCIPILKRIHERVLGESNPATHEPPPGLPSSAEEYSEQRQSYIKENKPRHEF